MKGHNSRSEAPSLHAFIRRRRFEFGLLGSTLDGRDSQQTVEGVPVKASKMSIGLESSHWQTT
jgi:hypothetical protein